MPTDRMDVFKLLKTKFETISSDIKNKKDDDLSSNALIIQILIVGFLLFLLIRALVHHQR